MARKVLDKVDEASRFNEKIKELDNHEDWNRDNFEGPLRMADTMLSQIEQTLLDLDNDIEREWERLDSKLDSYGRDQLERLESTDLGSGSNPTLKAYKTHLMEVIDLKDRVVEWKSAKEEIESICRENLKSIAKGLAADYVSGEARSNLSEIAEEMSTNKVESVVQDAKMEMFRELSRLNRDIDYIVAKNDELSRSELPSSSSNGGGVSTSSTNGDDGGEDRVYSLKGKDVSKQRSVLDEMFEENDFSTQSEAADVTDVTQPSLNRIINKVEEEFSEDYPV